MAAVEAVEPYLSATKLKKKGGRACDRGAMYSAGNRSRIVQAETGKVRRTAMYSAGNRGHERDGRRVHIGLDSVGTSVSSWAGVGDFCSKCVVVRGCFTDTEFISVQRAMLTAHAKKKTFLPNKYIP